MQYSVVSLTDCLGDIGCMLSTLSRSVVSVAKERCPRCQGALSALSTLSRSIVSVVKERCQRCQEALSAYKKRTVVTRIVSDEW